MVKFFGRKKNTEKTYANGKIRITNLKNLNPESFVKEGLTKENIGEQISLVSVDGTLYLNRDNEYSEILAMVMEALMSASRYTLDQYRKMLRKKFPDIKDFNDITKLQNAGNEQIVQATAMLLVPFEIDRRRVEKLYYSRK